MSFQSIQEAPFPSAPYRNDIEFALTMDREDPLRLYREEFHIPQRLGRPCLYFCGNSLGLQPKSTESRILNELEDWMKYGVEGHFDARNPWFSYHHLFSEKLATLAGAGPHEVVAMNSLTVNLHLMMVSFYRPSGSRRKIMIEYPVFPSDAYVVESQLRFHGIDPEDGIVELKPKEGDHCLRTEDILEAIDRNRNSLALIMLGGVNYYTGQLFDMAAITEAGHRAGITVGFDLAHAIGNVSLMLHEWNVDFAVWCSYKYLNSGPGSPGGAFVHERHGQNAELPRFAGWWGHDEQSRFDMKKGFVPMKGADGWQLSNAPVLGLAAHLAALDLFDQVGMEKLRKKSELLTGYLEFLIRSLYSSEFEIITPADPASRGAQISLLARGDGKGIFKRLREAGVIADWREPNVIRMAPVPLYNTFQEVFHTAQALRQRL